jgi:glucose-6-phosphate 1-dehydrogenase
LATLPDHFEVITQGVSKYGCLSKKKGWPRVAFEKPFGRDLESARKLNKRILKAFPEKQVYRVDHYLGKELIENISLMRFTNRIIEPLWCAKHIESVQIIANEKIGVEGRGGFYNKYGALKDFFQNHLLQIVALLGMEQPRRIAGKALRDEKVKVLRKVRVEDVLLGQYQGYGKERGVSRGSKTETFAVLKLRIGTGRWKGVPFFVKTGKMLNDGSSLIDIKFKKVKCLLDTCPRDTNHLRIILKPQNSIAFVVNSKKIGGTVVEPVEMNFSHSNEYGVNTPKAYETLLTEIIEGKQTAFVRNDEIEAAWKVVDSITRKKVFSYKKWSSGPKELKSWSMKNHVDWKA